MAEERTAYSKQDWNFLVNTANSGTAGGQGAVVDGLRRVVVALEANEKSANTLGTRIWWLNVWLLVVTVAIGAMTLVQATAAWKSLVR